MDERYILNKNRYTVVHRHCFSSSYEAFRYSIDTSQGFLQGKTDELKIDERQFRSFDGQSNCEQLHSNYRKHSTPRSPFRKTSKTVLEISL